MAETSHKYTSYASEASEILHAEQYLNGLKKLKRRERYERQKFHAATRISLAIFNHGNILW